MPELNISNSEDLAKLEGWTIKKSQLGTEGANPVLVLEASHPLASKKSRIKIMPTVSFGRSGNIMLVNALLNLKIEDIEDVKEGT